MTGSVTSWLSVIGLGITLITAAAAAVAFFRASYAKTTIETLKENNSALTEQVGILKEGHDNAVRELGELRAENSVLREALQGKADVERVIRVIEDHHRDVIEERLQFRRDWERVIKDLSNVVREFVESSTKSLGAEGV